MLKRTFRFLALALVLALGMALAGTASSPFTVRADSAQDKYTDLQKKLEEINKELDSLKDEKDATQEEKAQLQNKISVLKEQIVLLSGQIGDQQALLVAKQQELDAKKRERAATEVLFKERLRSIYMMRTDGVLSTILGANTYSEALTTSDTIQRITESDTELLDKLLRQKEAIEAEEVEQQTLLDEMQANQNSLVDKQGTLAGSLQQVNSSLDDIAAEQEAKKDEYDKTYAEYEKAKAEAEKEFISSGNLSEYVGGDFAWPVPNFYTISSPFGWRDLFGQQDYHTGTDITGSYSGAIYGAPIVAANDGYVTVARYGSTGYGVCVYVDHGGGYITRYGHCSSLAVSAGDYVSKGQVIAYAGNTGNSFGAHLHFEIRKDGVAIDPMQFYSRAGG